MSGESLDELLQKLVVDARQREADSRKAARPPSSEDEAAAERLEEIMRSLNPSHFGAVSEQGARDSQEDRFTVIPSMADLFPENVSENISYVAVFDGHEGAACAEFVRCYLHSHVVRHSAFRTDIRLALTEGFSEADRRFLGPPIPAEDPLSLQYTSGCTGALAMINHTRKCLITAHVGDSRALLALRDGTTIQLTRDHTGKSLTPAEREEIKSSGVAMVIGSYIWMTTGGDSQRINRHSVSLEVSRAFGDPLFKHGYNPMLQEYGRDIISVVPEINEYPLTAEHDGAVLLVASDGLFKAITNERAAEVAVNATDLQAAAQTLVSEAIAARCGDNTTVVLARISL